MCLPEGSREAQLCPVVPLPKSVVYSSYPERLAVAMQMPQVTNSPSLPVGHDGPNPAHHGSGPGY
jgi:hypothetical protein